MLANGGQYKSLKKMETPDYVFFITLEALIVFAAYIGKNRNAPAAKNVYMDFISLPMPKDYSKYTILGWVIWIILLPGFCTLVAIGIYFALINMISK